MIKSEKKLKKLFDNAKDIEQNPYYTINEFIRDAKKFLKDVKKYNVIMSMQVSNSGMTRKFNSRYYNMIMNICYNDKKSFDVVKVGGCGMDMHWHLIYRTCQDLTTKKDHNKYNSLASGQPLL